MTPQSQKKPPGTKTATKKKIKAKDDAPAFVKYDDPDLKVIIRLLPPNLTEEAFVKQIPPQYNPATNPSPDLLRLFYQKGYPSGKPFEEPTFSRAYLRFQTKEAANTFRAEMQHVVFNDPDSGDQVKCEMLKPIFGEVIEVSEKTSHGKITQEPIFNKFTSLRAQSKDVDLLKMIRSIHSEENRIRRDNNKKKKKKKESGAAPAAETEKPKSESPAPGKSTLKSVSKPRTKPTAAPEVKQSNGQDNKKDKRRSTKKSEKGRDENKKEAVPPKNGQKPMKDKGSDAVKPKNKSKKTKAKKPKEKGDIQVNHVGKLIAGEKVQTQPSKNAEQNSG